METKHPTWQRLMDESYARWQNGDLKDLPTNEFRDGLPELHRRAVILGNLNYQVQNGGFNQWVGNGYGLDAEEVSRILSEIGTANALKVKGMVDQLIPFIDFDEEDRGCMGDYWIMETVCDTDYDNCDKCNGAGVVEDECSECDGSGEIEYDREEEYCEGQDIAEAFDEQFYAFNEQFMDDVEKWLKQSTFLDGLGTLCAVASVMRGMYES